MPVQSPQRKNDSAHFTNFGCSMAPRCADGEGFLNFRTGFEKLPSNTWTSAEKWIADQQDYLDSWNRA